MDQGLLHEWRPGVAPRNVLGHLRWHPVVRYNFFLHRGMFVVFISHQWLLSFARG